MSFSLRFDKWLIATCSLILICTLFCVYRFYVRWKAINVITLPAPDCDFAKGPCLSELPTGEQIELSIHPTNMPVLTSVRLEVRVKNISVRKMYIDFKGTDMNMGEFRYTLSHHKQGVYSAQTILPTCIQEQMAWQATIHVEGPKKRYHAPFILVNERPIRTA